MTFSEAVNTCLREKYATFKGRAPRSEYWWFFVFYMLVLLVPMLLLVLIGGGMSMMDPTTGQGGLNIIGTILMVVMGIAMLAMIIPSIAVVVRRFHDRNMSGWWYLGLIVAGFIPFVGILASLAILVLMCLKGTDGPNNFGPDPLKGDADVFA
ncbi:DUF805 domain-containing protein [Yoonia sp. SS1-5]|uniref:DUF805 domain-containing protein n=1 Tax=Yoonia rhodophyticola TaxID=3137370 RepID=A0AAN0MBR0_9RHOB